MSGLTTPGGSDGKESACNVGDLGSIPRLERSPGERKGYPLQYSGLENCWAPKSLQMVTAAMELKDTCSLEEKL